MSEKTDPTVAQLFNLRGRVALITGGTSHLGRAMAAALAEAGARVIVTSRDEEDARAAAKTLPAPGGAIHEGIALDQMQPPSLERAIAQALERTGQIDVLVNNANAPAANDWRTVTAEQFDDQLRNATSYFLLSRLVRDAAVARQAAASIVLVGSMYGLVGSYPDAYGDATASPVAYHALKGGIIQMTRHLAVYWARDRVRVNCLSPGPFPQPHASPQLVDQLRRRSPMERIGNPSELKGAIVFLASDASSYMTGHNLVVDGGWTAW